MNRTRVENHKRKREGNGPYKKGEDIRTEKRTGEIVTLEVIYWRGGGGVCVKFDKVDEEC